MTWIDVSQAFVTVSTVGIIGMIIKSARYQRNAISQILIWQQQHMQDHMLQEKFPPHVTGPMTEGGESGTGSLRQTMFDALEKHMETRTTHSDLGTDGIREDGTSETP